MTLATCQEWTVEEDLVRNYADDVVLLTANGVHRRAPRAWAS